MTGHTTPFTGYEEVIGGPGMPVGGGQLEMTFERWLGGSVLNPARTKGSKTQAEV